MKNLKKISLISFLACATLAGGILTANAEVEAPVAEKYFRMETGAQVRVPDVVEQGQEDRDGLRFTAVMSDAYRKDVGELDALSVGMFIMPAAYASTPINYANCFGEGACYYWAGNGANTEGKKEILHVESYAYEEEEGADYLTMKASVWNMNVSSLDLEFVAVAYVTDGTNYYFADPAQGAKAVSVAQKALLNPADEIHVKEGDAALVESAYVTPFLGAEGVEVDYTETIYKQQKDGSYALIGENVAKRGVVKAYNTQAPKAYDNYAVYSRKSTARNLLIDGSANITTYYNYAGNRVVIWDGDEYTAPATYVQTEGGNEVAAMSVWTDGKYEGNYAQMYNTDGWEGPSWPDLKAIPATDTISMIMEMGNDPQTGEPGVYRNWQVGLYAPGWVDATNVIVQDYETGLVVVEGALVDIPTGFYKVTMQFASPITTIRSFGFRVQATPGFPIWYMDNLCAENVVEFRGFSVPYTFTDTITFKAPEVFDSSAWEGEAGACEVYYKAEGAADWSSLTAQDGVYSFTAEADVARYDIKAVAGTSEVVRTTIKGNIWADFDAATADRDYVVANVQNGAGLWDDSEQSHWIVSVDGFDGKFVTANVSGAWVYFQYKASAAAERKTFAGINGGVAPTKLGAWIYAPKAFTFNCAANVWGRFNYGVGSFEIQAGYHYYEIGLPASWSSGDAMIAFVFNYANYYIDALVVY